MKSDRIEVVRGRGLIRAGWRYRIVTGHGRVLHLSLPYRSKCLALAAAQSDYAATVGGFPIFEVARFPVTTSRSRSLTIHR